MFSQLADICRQLVESRTVIADTCRNILVNSSELGFNIVSYRSNSYASRSNSSELGFNIVLYRSNSQQLVHNSEELILCRRVWQDAVNAREAMTLVRDMYDNLRERYEIGTTYAPPTLDGELWQDF